MAALAVGVAGAFVEALGDAPAEPLVAAFAGELVALSEAFSASAVCFL